MFYVRYADHCGIDVKDGWSCQFRLSARLLFNVDVGTIDSLVCMCLG
jgi:hypothetical protein